MMLSKIKTYSLGSSRGTCNMDNTNHGRIMLFLMLLIVFLLGVVDGRLSPMKKLEIKKQLKLLNKPAVKTIKVVVTIIFPLLIVEGALDLIFDGLTSILLIWGELGLFFFFFFCSIFSTLAYFLPPKLNWLGMSYICIDKSPT